MGYRRNYDWMLFLTSPVVFVGGRGVQTHDFVFTKPTLYILDLAAPYSHNIALSLFNTVNTHCNSRYWLLYQLIIVTVSARMLFGTDAHVV